MARGGLGQTVGHGKFLSGAYLGGIAGGAQETSHHCVSALPWLGLWYTFPYLSGVGKDDLRVQKSRAGSILVSPEQRLRQLRI